MRQTLPAKSASLLLGLLLSANAAADTLERVSVSSSGEQANGESSAPAISADGKTVAFASSASNLVDGDNNNARDIFVRDRTTGKTERISLNASGGEANGGSSDPSISADGRYVAFVSNASNLVEGDTNADGGIFVRDRQTGTTVRANLLSDNSPACIGDGQISADGRFVMVRCGSAFSPRISLGWVYVRDLLLGTTTEIPWTFYDIPSLGGLSPDGRRILLTTARPLSPEDANGVPDVYFYDFETKAAERVSLTYDGQEAWPWVTTYPNYYYIPNNLGAIGPALMSADQSIVAFTSYSSNLVPYDYNGQPDIFVRDRMKNTLERVNISAMGEEAVGNISSLTGLSSDGRFIAFQSYAENLVHDDVSQLPDIFMHDRKTRHTWRISQTNDGTEGNGDSDYGILSSDGKTLAFLSKASNFVDNDTNGVADVYVRNMPTLPPSADLAITQIAKAMSDDPNTDRELEYTATVNNKGDTLATHAGFTVEFPKNLIPVIRDSDCESSQIGATGPYRVTCQIGNLAGGASASKQFMLTQTKDGFFQAHANAWADQFDPNNRDNTHTLLDYEDASPSPPQPQPQPQPNPLPVGDVALAVKPNMKTAKVGKKIQYKVIVNNFGEAQANDINLTLSFSRSIQFVSIPDGCQIELKSTLTCNLGSLRANRQTMMSIAIKPKQKGAMNATGSVSTTMKEANYENNNAVVEVMIK